MRNFLPYGYGVNPKIKESLKNITEEIDTENKKDKPDKDRIVKLKMEKLLRGLQINTGMKNNYRAMFPY